VERSRARRKERKGDKEQMGRPYSVIQGGGTFIENMPDCRGVGARRAVAGKRLTKH